MTIPSSIYSFTQNILFDHVSDTIRGTRDKIAKKTDKSPALMVHTLNGGKQMVSETSGIYSTVK